jgi:predicted nucleic acid-binding protein
MTTGVFLDTNVIVYGVDPNGGLRRERARAILGGLDRTRIVISQQVVSEFSNVVVHPRKLGRPFREAIVGIRMMVREWTVLPVTPEVAIAALEAADRWQLHYYDAQIWATAALNGVPVVLSEDFEDGLQLGPVRFVDPFAPDLVLESLVRQPGREG